MQHTPRPLSVSVKTDFSHSFFSPLRLYANCQRYLPPAARPREKSLNNPSVAVSSSFLIPHARSSGRKRGKRTTPRQTDGGRGGGGSPKGVQKGGMQRWKKGGEGSLLSSPPLETKRERKVTTNKRFSSSIFPSLFRFLHFTPFPFLFRIHGEDTFSPRRSMLVTILPLPTEIAPFHLGHGRA